MRTVWRIAMARLAATAFSGEGARPVPDHQAGVAPEISLVVGDKHDATDDGQRIKSSARPRALQ